MSQANKFANELTDRIPVIGHIKAYLHYKEGETEEAKDVFMKATRVVAVAGLATASTDTPVDTEQSLTQCFSYVKSFFFSSPDKNEPTVSAIKNKSAVAFRSPVAGAIGCLTGGFVFDGVHSLTVNSPRGSISLYVKAYNEPTGKNILKAILVPVADAGLGYAIAYPAIFVANNGITVTIKTIAATCAEHETIVTIAITMVAAIAKGTKEALGSNHEGEEDNGQPDSRGGWNPGAGEAGGDNGQPDSRSRPRPQEPTTFTFNYTPNCDCAARGAHCGHLDDFTQKMQRAVAAQGA